MESKLRSAAYWLTLAASLSPLVSIAASNILLVTALLVALIAYRKLEMPPRLALPLFLFCGGTIVALLLSPDPVAGWPQLKKLYVFASLPLLYTVLRRRPGVERLLVGWSILATASALWSFVQFWTKRQYVLDRGFEFYRFYVGDRATGFMSHWMTFGGEQMIVFLMLAASLLLGAIQMRKAVLWVAAGAIGVSIAISFARSVWLGTTLGAIYLLAAWRPKMLLLAPLFAGIGWFAAPAAVRERAISVYRPHGTVDSNEHRYITRRTGLEMVKARPWIGIGPEIVGRDFHKYVPSEIPRPLPEGFYGHLHNLYLQYAAERGVPTLLAFLWFIGAILAYLWRAPFHWSKHGAAAVTIAVLMEAFFEVNLGDSEVLRMFLAVVACAHAATRPMTADA